MNGGIAPLLLMSATVGLLLASTTLELIALGLIGFGLATLIGFTAPHLLVLQLVFAGLWLSIIVTAGLVYLPAIRLRRAVVALAVNAGLWLGACAAVTSDLRGLGVGLLPALLAIPANRIATRKFNIIMKVVASWMIAIAALSAFVSLMPTPGYKPDHME